MNRVPKNGQHVVLVVLKPLFISLQSFQNTPFSHATDLLKKLAQLFILGYDSHGSNKR